MILETSCVTEDWSNGCWKFSSAISEIHYLNTEIENNYLKLQSYFRIYCFTIFFYFKNAALVSVRDLKTSLKILPTSNFWNTASYIPSILWVSFSLWKHSFNCQGWKDCVIWQQSNETYWIQSHSADTYPNETLPLRKRDQERIKRRERLLHLFSVHLWRALPK